MGSEQVDEELCWVCLAGAEQGELAQPCKCPRLVHPKCLARWQLQSAGKSEESKCRFCGAVLPDWRPVLTPAGLRPSTPVVSVHYNGVCYRLRVKPGPEGFETFRKQLHKITGMPMLECMQITFQCKSPDTAQELSFKGISAYDAAIHCAAVSAAERLTHHARRSADAARTGPTVAGASTSSQGAGEPAAPEASGNSGANAAGAWPTQAALPGAVTGSAAAGAGVGGSSTSGGSSFRPQAMSANGLGGLGGSVASASSGPVSGAMSHAGSGGSSEALLTQRSLSMTHDSSSQGAAGGMRRVDSRVIIDDGVAGSAGQGPAGAEAGGGGSGAGGGNAAMRLGAAGTGGLGAKQAQKLQGFREFFRRIFTTPTTAVGTA